MQYTGGKLVSTSYDCYIAMELAEDGDLFVHRCTSHLPAVTQPRSWGTL